MTVATSGLEGLLGPDEDGRVPDVGELLGLAGEQPAGDHLDPATAGSGGE